VVYRKNKWIDLSAIPGLASFESVYYEFTNPTSTTAVHVDSAYEKIFGIYTYGLIQDSK